MSGSDGRQGEGCPWHQYPGRLAQDGKDEGRAWLTRGKGGQRGGQQAETHGSAHVPCPGRETSCPGSRFLVEAKKSLGVAGPWPALSWCPGPQQRDTDGQHAGQDRGSDWARIPERSEPGEGGSSFLCASQWPGPGWLPWGRRREGQTF